MKLKQLGSKVFIIIAIIALVVVALLLCNSSSNSVMNLEKKEPITVKEEVLTLTEEQISQNESDRLIIDFCIGNAAKDTMSNFTFGICEDIYAITSSNVVIGYDDEEDTYRKIALVNLFGYITSANRLDYCAETGYLRRGNGGDGIYEFDFVKPPSLVSEYSYTLDVNTGKYYLDGKVVKDKELLAEYEKINETCIPSYVTLDAEYEITKENLEKYVPIISAHKK